MKPPLGKLRQGDNKLSSCIDDLYLQGKTRQKCIENVIDTIILLEDLGLVIHPEKSVTCFSWFFHRF